GLDQQTPRLVEVLLVGAGEHRPGEHPRAPVLGSGHHVLGHAGEVLGAVDHQLTVPTLGHDAAFGELTSKGRGQNHPPLLIQRVEVLAEKHCRPSVLTSAPSGRLRHYAPLPPTCQPHYPTTTPPDPHHPARGSEGQGVAESPRETPGWLERLPPTSRLTPFGGRELPPSLSLRGQTGETAAQRGPLPPSLSLRGTNRESGGSQGSVPHEVGVGVRPTRAGGTVSSPDRPGTPWPRRSRRSVSVASAWCEGRTRPPPASGSPSGGCRPDRPPPRSPRRGPLPWTGASRDRSTLRARRSTGIGSRRGRTRHGGSRERCAGREP